MRADAGSNVRVEVAVAWPELQVLIPLTLAAGSTAGDAIEASGLRSRFAGIEIRPDRIGVFSKPCAPDRVLDDGDRVEIYRPLRVDPKVARRLAAATARDSKALQSPSGS